MASMILSQLSSSTQNNDEKGIIPNKVWRIWEAEWEKLLFYPSMHF